MKKLYKKKYIIFLTVLIAAAMVLSVSVSFSANASTPNSPTKFSKQQVSANGFADMGPLPSSQIVSFVAYVPIENQQLLQSYVEQISNPQSSDYGHFMTVSQVEKTFTNPKQFNNVLSQLSADNFKIQFSAMDSLIVASGSVAQIKSYLGLNTDLFSNGSSSYYASYGTPLIGDVSIYASNYTQSIFSHPSTLVTQSVINKEKQLSSQINQTFSIEAYPATVLQNVYNETGIMQNGYMGQGGSIGILDFCGNPYVRSELNYFDQLFGLPNPPSLNIVPIGPYDPNIGIATGWSDEISLDVESSHTMSPLSNITLYIANGNLPLITPIAFIDQQNAVNSLSQSFSIPESSIANFPVLVTDYNVILADTYYEMGALEGITFSASTGDAGGSGYSSGPLGTPGYPSTSPFVTALGGTETYVAYENGLYSSSMQTAWSNYGFVPYNINYGGGTGGVSMFEPLPWYQVPLISSIPSSYPLGRLVPDVSLNAALFPGILFIFGQNQTFISGGTSESSPLFAGIIAFSAGMTNHSYGLANPALYQYGLSSVLSGKIFNPISFGYIIPWTESASGYNLVTGLGSLNIGGLSYFHNVSASQKANSLNVSVEVSGPLYNNTIIPEFPDGSAVDLAARVTHNGTVVSTGSFNATIVSLQNINTVPLHYNSSLKEWTGIYSVRDGTEGMAFVQVSGESNSVSGSAFNEIFLGYYVYIESVYSQYPYALQFSVPVYGQVTWLDGGNVSGNLSLSVFSYSIISNSYYLEGTTNASVVDGALFEILAGNYETGVTLISGGGGYFYLPFFNGVLLQNSLIMGPVASEPGAVAPGQYVLVEGILSPPLNTPIFSTYVNVMVGSNVTFSLVSSNGAVLSSVFSTPDTLSELLVPMGTPSGLYTVFINTSYNSYSLGTYVNGSFFGQIWVSPTVTTPVISISPSTVQEGQIVNVSASVTENGLPIEYGMYSVTVYPADLSSDYYLLTLFNYIALLFNTTSGMWEGSIAIPSGYSPGSINYENGITDWSGPYDLYVTGESWNGVLTTTAQSAQKSFFVNSSVITSLQNETKSLQSEIASLRTLLSGLNQSFQSQQTSMQNEISSLQHLLSGLNNTTLSQKSNLNSLRSTVNYAEILALIAVIIAIVSLILAFVRKKKS